MIGKTISHYRVLEKIGEGGMGQVYLAEDTSLERKVALKFLGLGLQADPVAHKRFIREAKSAAAIDHPYICHINEVAQTDDGQDFIVMEYVEGETLKDRLDHGKVSIKEALRIGSEVAQALERAHSAGVIHRDLKPSNIMLTPSGHAKVLDFGLAKRVTRDKEDLTSVLTREGTTLGTLAYMSPEQLRGSAVDTRADVFSLGVVLYEMLTGVHPFSTGTQAETVNAILSEHPSTLSRYIQGAPDLLQHTVEKMLAKQPGERYQSVHEIRTNLTKVMEEITSPTPLAEPQEKRKNWLLGAAGATVVTLVLVLVWFYFLTPSSQQPPAPLVAVPLTSFPGFESHATLSPDGEHVAFVRGDWVGDILVKQIGAEEGEPLSLTSSGEDTSPVWSPDGHVVAFLRSLGERRYSVLSVPSLGGTERQWAEIHMSVSPLSPYLAWTPDSESLVVAGYPESDEGAGLFLLSLQTREMRRLTRTPEDYDSDCSVSLSPDGRTLAFIRSTGHYHGYIYTLNLDDEMSPLGKPKLLTIVSENCGGLTWSVDGKAIIYSSGTWPNFRLWKIETTEPTSPETLVFAGTGVRYPAVSRRGNRLVYDEINPDFNMYQLDVDESGAQVGTPGKFQSSSRVDWSMDYSPDGTRIAFSSDRNGSMELFICDSDGSNVVPLTSFGGPMVYLPRWSPDGQWIAFCARPKSQGDIFVIAAEGGLPKPLTEDLAHDTISGWSMDGEWIYFSSDRGGERAVWRIPVGGGTPIKAKGAELGKSSDEEWIYYRSLEAEQVVDMWKESSQSGLRVDLPNLGEMYHFLVKDKIYYVTSDSSDRRPFSIRFYDLETETVREVATIDGTFGWGFTVSPDGRTILYAQDDQPGSDLKLVENFQ